MANSAISRRKGRRRLWWSRPYAPATRHDRLYERYRNGVNLAGMWQQGRTLVLVPAPKFGGLVIAAALCFPSPKEKGSRFFASLRNDKKKWLAMTKGGR
ncbi:hypothetical protein M1N58_02345 [Dehalococcoidales bacterium]|nr:hypothetical protein [Dehalococcoidales bacterium]